MPVDDDFIKQLRQKRKKRFQQDYEAALKELQDRRGEAVEEIPSASANNEPSSPQTDERPESLDPIWPRQQRSEAPNPLERIENAMIAWGIPKPAIYMLIFMSFTIGALFLMMLLVVVSESLNPTTTTTTTTQTSTSTSIEPTTTIEETTTTLVSTTTSSESTTTITLRWECNNATDCIEKTYFGCRVGNFYRFTKRYDCADHRCREKDVKLEIYANCLDSEYCDNDRGCLALSTTSTSTTRTVRTETTEATTTSVPQTTTTLSVTTTSTTATTATTVEPPTTTVTTTLPSTTTTLAPTTTTTTTTTTTMATTTSATTTSTTVVSAAKNP